MAAEQDDVSESVADAAKRLDGAISGLERGLRPLMARLAKLEREVADAEAFKADRAQLAEKLDAATAGASKQKAEFDALAGETKAELERVIAQVRNVLETG